MELHKNTANAFAKYLSSHGYPKDSIAFEWVDNKFRVDIAILDISTNIPIAIYEVKERKDENDFRRGVGQLVRYVNFIDLPITCGLVFPKQESPYFEYCDVTDIVSGTTQKSLNEVKFYSDDVEPLSYYNQKISSKSMIVEKRKKENRRTINWFKIFCWMGVPITSLVLIILDRTGCLPLTSDRLIIDGVCLLFFFLPFIPSFVIEIKFGDYSVLFRDEPKQKTD